MISHQQMNRNDREKTFSINLWRFRVEKAAEFLDAISQNRDGNSDRLNEKNAQ